MDGRSVKFCWVSFKLSYYLKLFPKKRTILRGDISWKSNNSIMNSFGPKVFSKNIYIYVNFKLCAVLTSCKKIRKTLCVRYSLKSKNLILGPFGSKIARYIWNTLARFIISLKKILLYYLPNLVSKVLMTWLETSLKIRKTCNLRRLIT